MCLPVFAMPQLCYKKRVVEKRLHCLTNLPALFIPSSLLWHYMLPPLHSAPHKTSRCLLSSFIRLCFTAFTWQPRCLLHSETNSSTDSHVKSSLQWTLHLLSSALPPTPAQEVTWAWPSGTSSCPRRERRREGRKALRFPWGTSLLWVTAEADTLQQSSRQDWGPRLHKSSRSECSKTFVSRLSHPLPCAEMWSYSFLHHPLYSLKLTCLPFHHKPTPRPSWLKPTWPMRWTLWGWPCSPQENLMPQITALPPCRDCSRVVMCAFLCGYTPLTCLPILQQLCNSLIAARIIL